MDFELTQEQRALQDSLSRLVAKEYTFGRRREIAASEAGFSADLWHRYADLGLLALPFPARLGGLDGTTLDIAAVMEIFGPALVLEPYLETVVLCGGLIRDFADEATKQTLLPQIGAGELKLALAHHEPKAGYALERVGSRATRFGSGWLIRGEKSSVLHAAAADKLIVSARTTGEQDDREGISLFLVDRHAEGLALQEYRCHDDRRIASVLLADARVPPEALLGPSDAALPAVERAVDQAIAALCAEAVGIMSALGKATLEYLRTRKQFGRPIGSFQALQHRVVDMFVATEQARSMMYLAAASADSNEAAERTRTAAGAKAYVGQALRLVGPEAIQLHGAIGMTEELIVSHWFKRLTMIDLLFGDADWHLSRLSDAMQADAAPGMVPPLGTPAGFPAGVERAEPVAQ
jgi:alkylation response protein AidB-like acyl-CoA dehydrogenase